MAEIEDPTQGAATGKLSTVGKDEYNHTEGPQYSPPQMDIEEAAPDYTQPSRVVDPLEPREGRDLVWGKVNMTLLAKGENKEKKILDDVFGEVPKSQVTAIMGPSGSGKTSLLNILAGRTKSNSSIKISADVRLNNFSVDPTDMDVRRKIAFVAQDDSLQITATPREAIKFSARLRLPKSLTDEELDTLTNRMLKELGLEKCSDTIVGGMLLKGLSGGERKRTSVGVELVTRPALVFLDEPTSVSIVASSNLKARLLTTSHIFFANFFICRASTALMLFNSANFSGWWQRQDPASFSPFTSHHLIFSMPSIVSFYLTLVV